MPGFAHTMIGNAVLRKIIRADFFRSITCAYLLAANFGNGSHPLLVLDFQKLCAKHAHGPLAVLRLRPFRARLHHNARWLVCYANGCFHFVYVLPTFAARTGKSE